jgi:hypothetical protein
LILEEQQHKNRQLHTTNETLHEDEEVKLMKEAKTLKDKDDRTQGKVSRPKDKKMSKTTLMVITKYSLTPWKL